MKSVAMIFLFFIAKTLGTYCNLNFGRLSNGNCICDLLREGVSCESLPTEENFWIIFWITVTIHLILVFLTGIFALYILMRTIYKKFKTKKKIVSYAVILLSLITVYSTCKFRSFLKFLNIFVLVRFFTWLDPFSVLGWMNIIANRVLVSSCIFLFLTISLLLLLYVIQ